MGVKPISIREGMSADEQRAHRDAFGQFATGVTIVTTNGVDGEPIGVTANSFSSVSLEPPMVIWSLAQDAFSRESFESAEHFCVHVLTESQRGLSERFARQGENKFAEVEWMRGADSIPMLRHFAARFHCRIANQYPIGDHVLFVGEVLVCEKTDERPLVFHGGGYALAERRMMERAALDIHNGKSIRGDRRKK